MLLTSNFYIEKNSYERRFQKKNVKKPLQYHNQKQLKYKKLTKQWEMICTHTFVCTVHVTLANISKRRKQVQWEMFYEHNVAR